jgi:mycothiol synthase
MHHVEVITSLEGEQIEELQELIDASAQADGHEPVGEHKFLRLKHGDDLAIGVLAYEGGRLVGYGHTVTWGSGDERRVSCEMTVHPEFRRRGIGRTLLNCIIEHAELQEARTLDLWAYNDSGAARAIAGAFGFDETRRLLHMHRHPGPPPVPVMPEGVTLRAFRPGADEDMVLALNNRIFAGHPENGNWTLEDLQARMRQPWFNPDDLLIAEVDGTPGGFHWLKVEDRPGEGRVGEVYVIGVLPDFAGMGLGRYLLAEGLTHLSQRGVDAVAVYVDQANERAVALYWSFEFHHHHADVLYSLPLPAAQAGRRRAAAAG